MKQRRKRSRTTLQAIAEILTTKRPLTSRDLAKATAIPASAVRQILKRLSNDGWLLRDPRRGQAEQERRCRRRYRLTTRGRREARIVLQKQARLMGGRWYVVDTGKTSPIALGELPYQPQSQPWEMNKAVG